jgi:hypothetical protein
MRAIRVSFAILSLATALCVVACEKKGPAERAGEKIDNAVDKAGDAVKDTGDKMKDAVDK